MLVAWGKSGNWILRKHQSVLGDISILFSFRGLLLLSLVLSMLVYMEAQGALAQTRTIPPIQTLWSHQSYLMIVVLTEIRTNADPRFISN